MNLGKILKSLVIKNEAWLLFNNLSAKSRGLPYKKGVGQYQNWRFSAKVKERKVSI